MIPSSRGSAGIGALVLTTTLLILGAWVAFATADSEVEAKLLLLETAGKAGSNDPIAGVLTDGANALSKVFEELDGTPRVPTGVRFREDGKTPVPDREPPGVTALAGRQEGDRLVLTWQLTGEEPPSGFLVERVGDDAGVLDRKVLPVEARSFEDSLEDALAGSRTYRISALTRDGTVAGGEQKRVQFRLDFEVEFLGAGPEGRGRFRVVWLRPGGRVSGTFDAEFEGWIGGAVPENSDHLALDMRTGWRFAGFAGKREVVPREVEVPQFRPNGLLAREPESGTVVFEVREMPVPQVAVGALVVPGGDGPARWLPKVKD